MHMAETQRSTGVGNEEGTGGEYGQGLALWVGEVCVGGGGQEGREGLVSVD